MSAALTPAKSAGIRVNAINVIATRRLLNRY
jgi:hypothetical protein